MAGVTGVADQIARLDEAIAAQDGLRPGLGDDVVDTVISALRARRDALLADQLGTSPDLAARAPARSALEQLRARIPAALADKAEIIDTAARRGAERRNVTVLFADLSGFTDLSERFDPEIIRAFQGDLFDELSNVVYEYEGFVEKFVGDAILAVFGAPLSHEDDPERALRAALAIRERMDDVNRRWQERLGESLTLHIGINTGTVIAGQIGSDPAGAYAVTGDTITTASRLQTAAAPGQILVSHNTQRLAHEAFAFGRLEPLRVKGKREPLTIFELLRARLHPGKSRGLQGLSSAMVGRDAELAHLSSVSDRLVAGTGAIVLLVGEAGMGKSRLLAEWQAAAQDGPIRWLEGRSFAGASAVPYGPFLDMCRRYAGITDEESEALAGARLRQTLEGVLPGDTEAIAIVVGMLGMRLDPTEADVLRVLTPEVLAQHLFAFIERLFSRLAVERPTILVMEDLHWADTSSIELLEHLLPLTRRLPLAIVGVTRPSPGGSVLRPHILTEYADLLTTTELAPLADAATVDLIRRLLSSSAFPVAARKVVLAKAEGNPFYVEEVIRTLIERGGLVRAEDGQRWVATALIDDISVPDTLHGVLMARLDRLPDGARRVAQQAAVIGRIFPYRVLQGLAPSDALEADLVLLERQELILELRRDPEVEYIFKHALTHEVAYESLLAPDRRELHARAGETIEREFADRLGESTGLLGGHFLRGERWEKAFRYLRKAGDAASRLHAHPEARQHYDGALQALAEMPVDDHTRRNQINMTIKRVTVSWGAEDPERNLTRLAHAVTLAEAMHGASQTRAADRARLARVRYWMGVLHYLRDEPLEAIAYFQQVLTVGQELGDDELLAMPSALIGRALVMQGQFERAEALLTRALDPLARAADWLEWSYTLAFLGATLAVEGQVELGRAETERALARSLETGNQTAIAGCLLAMSFHPFLARDADGLREAGRVAAAAGEQAGSPLLVHIAICFEAWGLSMLGRHEAARERMADAQAVAEALGGRLFMADWVAAANAELALNAGRPLEAVERAQVAVEMAQAVEGVFGEGLAQRAWGIGLARSGAAAIDASEGHLGRSLELFEAGGSRVEVAHTEMAWGQVCRERADEIAAADHFRRAAAGFEVAGLAVLADRARRSLKASAVREDDEPGA